MEFVETQECTNYSLLLFVKGVLVVAVQQLKEYLEKEGGSILEHAVKTHHKNTYGRLHELVKLVNCEFFRMCANGIRGCYGDCLCDEFQQENKKTAAEFIAGLEEKVKTWKVYKGASALIEKDEQEMEVDFESEGEYESEYEGEGSTVRSECSICMTSDCSARASA